MNNKRFVKKLMQLVAVQSESHNTDDMQKQITKIVQSISGCIISRDDYGNIYVTKGVSTTYPTMVCHIDTVHSIVKGVIKPINIDGNIVAFSKEKMEQVGTGGDDKVGIHITLELLKKHDVMKAVFFLDEEVGCLGSSKADFGFFDNSRYVLECDRRGYGDFVNEISGIKLTNKKFEKAIKNTLSSYGFTLSSGGMTDVQMIALNCNAVCANMSCGYYEPHTDSEYINVNDVILTYEMCDNIFTTVTDIFKVKTKRVKKYDYSYYNRYYTDFDFDYDKDYNRVYHQDKKSDEPLYIKEIGCGMGCTMVHDYCKSCDVTNQELQSYYQ